MRMLLLAALLILIPAFAAAQDMEDADYVDYYFGTQVVLTTAAPVNDSNRTYWGELLPQEYMYGQAVLVNVINNAREAAGRDDLLDVAMYPISIGSDKKLDDGSWEYYIEFRDCTPSEAQLVLDEYGLGDALADADVSFQPMKIAYFSNYTSSIDLIALELPGGVVEFDPNSSVQQYFDDIDALLSAKYGDNFKAEIYYSVGKSVLAPDSSSISVTVYLDGAENTLNSYYDY